MKIGIVANQSKKEAVILADRIIEYLDCKNLESIYCRNIYENPKEVSLLSNADFVIVLGGDGTILGLVRSLENKNIPLLGINLGSFGFIAEADPKYYREAVDRLVSGDYFIRERNLLKCYVYSKAYENPEIIYSLNEFVMGKADINRMLSIDTYINDEFLVNYKADGIIVASSTGSTAYNLSAGGPVMHPSVEAYIITPICPHTLNERPLIVPKSEVLVIKNRNGGKCLFTVDGQISHTLSGSDYVKIEATGETVKLIEFNKSGFYEKLKSRLFWGKQI